MSGPVHGAPKSDLNGNTVVDVFSESGEKIGKVTNVGTATIFQKEIELSPAGGFFVTACFLSVLVFFELIPDVFSRDIGFIWKILCAATILFYFYMFFVGKKAYGILGMVMHLISLLVGLGSYLSYKNII
jgi:hypothetical protein